MEKGKYYKEITSENKVLRFDLKELWQYRDLVLLLVEDDDVLRGGLTELFTREGHQVIAAASARDAAPVAMPSRPPPITSFGQEMRPSRALAS